MPPRYSEEFKIGAVKQVVDNGYSVLETAQRLGIDPDSLRSWMRKFESPEAKAKHQIEDSKNAEIKRLQKERDILKKAAAYFASNPD